MTKKVTFIDTCGKHLVFSLFFIGMIVVFLWTLGTFVADLIIGEPYAGLMENNSEPVVTCVLLFQLLVIMAMRQYLLKQMDRYNGIYVDGFWRN